jgi:C-8 sterol isomerase
VAFYDTVLDGEAWYYKEGEFTRSVYTPGDHVIVNKGEAAGMHYPDHVWMIEYARGPLLTLLPFGLADGLISTLDFKTVYQTLVIYFSLLTRQLSKSQKVAMGTLAAVSLLLLSTRSRRKKRGRK